MKHSLFVVVALLMVGFVFGCNSSGGTKVGKAGRVPGPTGVVEVTPQEAALITQGLEGNRAAAEDAAKELQEEAAALSSAGGGSAKKSAAASGKKAEVAASTDEAVKAADPAAENSAGSEAQPAEQKPESAPRVAPLEAGPSQSAPAGSEAQPTEDKKSEENAAPKKEGATGDPLLDRFRMEAERLAEGKEVASSGPKKRCMACDDVSDTVQCLTCWGHHLKSAEHLAAPEGKMMCPQCYNEHEFQAEHREPPTVVVYDQNAPCASCREAHSTGPHCPHCSKSMTENMKVDKEGNLVSDPEKKAKNQEDKKE